MRPRLSGPAATRCLGVLAIACAASAAGAGAPEPKAETCLGDLRPERPIGDMLEEAVAVLRACGHAPDAYRLELRIEERVAVPASGRAPAVSAVFEPLDDREGYAVAVGPLDPCVVEWVWSPERWTAWQRDVLERAREGIGAAWDGGDLEGVRVTESRDHLGVRLTSSAGSELRLVLRKTDLELQGTFRGGAP